jgi:hypothetical protein
MSFEGGTRLTFLREDCRRLKSQGQENGPSLQTLDRIACEFSDRARVSLLKLCEIVSGYTLICLAIAVHCWLT